MSTQATNTTRLKKGDNYLDTYRDTKNLNLKSVIIFNNLHIFPLSFNN